jgi:hypothetical protein
VRFVDEFVCDLVWDLARWLTRICSVVNTRPHTLQRQPGDMACALPGTDC